MQELTKQIKSQECLALASKIKAYAKALGFQQVGITDPYLKEHEENLKQWLAKGYHGNMQYMDSHGKNGLMRARPTELIPETKSIIVVRMDYLPPDAPIQPVLNNPHQAAISRYATGKDYHRFMRKKLLQLAKYIEKELGSFSYRPFADSAPVMEKPLAEKAGLGWIGKHTVLINRHAGSWFFLGVLFTDLELPLDAPVKNHCGSCSACIDICPTRAIVGPKQLDARKCISYLTIENKGSIPIELRAKIGNRIFGCDDCQLICPWNRYAKVTNERHFFAKDHLKSPKLLDLFNWTEEDFLKQTEGSAIRRAGYHGWLRNIAVALGNAPFHPEILSTLNKRLPDCSDLVQEHIVWAIAQQQSKIPTIPLYEEPYEEPYKEPYEKPYKEPYEEPY